MWSITLRSSKDSRRSSRVPPIPENANGTEENTNNDSPIYIRGVATPFARTADLHDINLEIGDRESFTMLGLSGLGTTAPLRMVAGFETLRGGPIKPHGGDVTKRCANVRSVNIVFQGSTISSHEAVVTHLEDGLRALVVQKATTTL